MKLNALLHYYSSYIVIKFQLHTYNFHLDYMQISIAYYIKLNIFLYETIFSYVVSKIHLYS